jgi:predicted HTH domain antitoxin
MTGFDVVEAGQSGVKHHVLTADQIDVAGNALYGNDALTFWCWPSVHRAKWTRNRQLPHARLGRDFEQKRLFSPKAAEKCLGIWQNKKGYPRMSTVILELDQDVIAILEQQHQPVGETAREMIVFELYRRGSLSSGKASQLLSLTRYEFIRRASELRIPYFRFTEQELKDEIHQSESL